MPDGEVGEFLMGTTCFGFGTAEQVRSQLEENRRRMTTGDYHECYAIADSDTDEAMRKYARNEVWVNPERLLALLKEDGSVEFAGDVTVDELKWAVTVLLQQREIDRQERLRRLAAH